MNTISGSRPGKAVSRLAGLFALVGVLCLTAGSGDATEILIQQFTVPETGPLAFTYTSLTIGKFWLPDAAGVLTQTITFPLTMSFPHEEVITQTWVPGWEHKVVITTTMLDGDGSWSEVITQPITQTITITDTSLVDGDTDPFEFRTFTVVHLDVDENEEFVVTFTHNAIPEPATAVLLGASALGLLLRRVRRRRRAR